MTSSPLSVVVRQLRTAAERDGEGKTDAELLTRFLSHHDGDALATLVRRHAPMVWGVCRRTLHNPHDAEDAFQATFLVLVRKAATVRPREMLANWLYGVARQTAVRSRATAAKRGGREMQMEQLPEPVVAEARANELLPLLDQELSHLPQRFQALIVLCDLEGKTRKEAARQLGCPEGTVASRLARARELLAKRLARRGLAVSGASLAAALSQTTASADVPVAVLNSTINIATQLATGQSADMISAPVAALTEGTLKAMLITKLKAVYTVVLALGFLAAGTTGLVYRQATAQDIKPPVAEERVTPPPKQEPEKEPFTAWGKESGGLQAGLGFHAGEKRAYSHGETAKLVLRVRNVGKEEVKFQYLRQFFIEQPPAVTDDAGKPVTLPGVTAFGRHIPQEVTLAPGKEIELYELDLELRPSDENDGRRPATLYGTGKFGLQYERVIGNTSSGQIKPDPILGKLATGKLELEVIPKETVTAWGKEAGGLQAGLGFHPGGKRVYGSGETAKLVLRVRNVGKEEAKFEYVYAFFVENPPEVTDDAGKKVPLIRLEAGGLHAPKEAKLAPGKEIELYELELQLKPAAKAGDIDLAPLKTTRKYQIQYERLTGPTSAGPRKPDPLLEKLSTGKLELEVKTEPPADTGKTPPKNESGKADPFAPPEAPPTQMEMRLAATVKQFLVTMRNHHGDKNANALREFIDPRYLKMHDLTDRDLSVPMPAVGSIINFETAGDGQTILCIVDVEATPPKKIREALLLRVSVHEGKPYITPQKAPDPKTGAFTPWILRTRTDYP
ncbi:RNA polymerase sigma factor [Zavarzinella formosa]|uniref:RNA polymerase sigma factor n=1 Tax=Zavarzinella formosa TaxID=360055 RepID=UPI0002EB4F2B|nr:sigma-70 family RNA polymerase sigma factor [Zavarzinella formosa]